MSLISAKECKPEEVPSHSTIAEGKGKFYATILVQICVLVAPLAFYTHVDKGNETEFLPKTLIL